MKRVSFSVPEDLHEPLKAYAKTRKLTLSQLCGVALYAYIRRSPTKNKEIMDKLQGVL